MMIKLLFTFIVCMTCLTKSLAQIDADIMRRVHSNIQGFELSKFFENSKTVKTDIIINRIENLDLDCQLSYEEISVGLKYPQTDFELFGFRKTGLKCDKIIETKVNYDGLDYNIFLIAIDTLTKQVKYVSGHMFLNNISLDFELDKKVPESYIDYIELRMYYLQVSGIKFLRKKGGIIYFKGYSNFTRELLELSVNTDSWNNMIRIEKRM